MVACEQQSFDVLFKANRPIESFGFMLSPCIGVQIVYEIAASNDQYSLIPQPRESFSKFIMMQSLVACSRYCS